MALRFADRVKDTSTTTGTGVCTVSGSPPASYQALSVIAVGQPISYEIVGQTGSEVEGGEGVVLSATTFSRLRVTASSNNNALVNWLVAPLACPYNSIS